MQEGRWRTVLEIYESAAELPREERRAFVESSARDAEIAAEVFALLIELDSSEGQAPVSSSPKPERIGRYQLQEPLGRGGMGEVFSARDVDLDRTVALKFLNPDSFGSASIRRLIREAKAASALNHPNIVTIHEVIESGSSLAIVMELVEGVALRTLTGAPMPLAKLVQIGRQIAQALSAAHKHGITHRDVKPENILVREDGYVKLLDFGLAVRLDSTGESTAGLIKGTLRYMSPEQARGERVGPATDIFSLGIVLYELATGRHPFSGDSNFETAHAILTQEPAPPSDFQRGLPEQFELLILSMLRKEPSARPSAQQVAADLDLVQGQEVNRWRVRLRIGWRVPAAIAALVAVAITVWMVQRSALRPSMQPLEAIPLTSDPGLEFEPRLSPDAKRVVFTRGVRGSEPEVVVQTLGSETAQVVIAGRNMFSPVWSPRGDKIAVLRTHSADSNRRDVVLVELKRLTLQKVAEVDTPGEFQDWVPGPYLDFSPDGRFLVACDGWSTSVQRSLVLISIETGDKFPVTTPGAAVHGDFSPRFSPDGTRIAFTRMRGFGAADLHVLDLTSEHRPAGLPTRISTSDLWNAFPAWTADGRNLVFAAGVYRSTRLKLVRAKSGETPAVLPLAETSVTTMDLRPTENGLNRITYARFARDDDIYRLEIGKDNHPAPIIVSSFVDELPHYSPDGSKIAFLSNRTGSVQMWVAFADGSNPRQVSHLDSAEIHNFSWHPNNKLIAAKVMLPGQSGLFEIDTDSGSTRQLVQGEAGHPSYSPDGRWIYFPSRRSGFEEAWRIAAGGGTPERANLPTGWLHFLAGGKTLVYARGLEVFQQSVPNGPPIRLFSSIFSLQSSDVTSSAVYAVTRNTAQEPWRLVVRSLSSGEMRPVADYDRDVGNGISVSPDGRYVLLTQRAHLVLDLMLLDKVDLSGY